MKLGGCILSINDALTGRRQVGINPREDLRR